MILFDCYGLFVILPTNKKFAVNMFLNMQKKFLFLLFMFLVCVNQLFAQIQGIVTDAQTGEPIPFANVF